MAITSTSRLSTHRNRRPIQQKVVARLTETDAHYNKKPSLELTEADAYLEIKPKHTSRLSRPTARAVRSPAEQQLRPTQLNVFCLGFLLSFSFQIDFHKFQHEKCPTTESLTISVRCIPNKQIVRLALAHHANTISSSANELVISNSTIGLR